MANQVPVGGPFDFGVDDVADLPAILRGVAEVDDRITVWLPEMTVRMKVVAVERKPQKANG